MNTSKYIVHYKGATITFENNVYKINEFPLFPFVSLNQAKAEIDRMEQSLANNIYQFFENLKRPDAKTTNAEG